MSKVYEALRQKQQETGDRRVPGNGASSETVLTSTSRRPEMEMSAEVLQILDTTDEEIPAINVEVTPSFEPSPIITDPAATIFPNGFRRLKLAYRESSRLVFQTDPDGLAAEQFRFLRRTLEQKFPKGGVVLITSPAPKDGKTLTAVNLSACLADSGRSTLLVEADIRQPSIHRLLGVKAEEPGIEDALAGSVEPGQTVRFVEQLSLCVAMVSEPPADPFRVVSGKGVQEFLDWARRHFHWVVIDSPPVLPAADVTQLVSKADAVLLVVRAQSTPRDLATRAFELLGNHLSGIILNEATIESNPYYRYLSDYRQRRLPQVHTH
jgi:protein-tyrosine kinase